MQIFRIHSRWFPLLSACVALGILLLILLPLPNPASLDDGLRHLAIGRIMAEHGIRAVTGGLDRRDSVTGWGDFFSAGYFTQHNTDPWFLADVLMMPLGSLPTLIALKLISICSIIILIAATLFSFRTFRLPPFPAGALLLLLLLGEPKFTGRLLLARPFLLMTSMAILMLPAVLRRRHGAVFLLLMFATLFSHLFVLPLGIAALGALWLWSRREKRSALLCLAALLGGTGTGLLLHPTSSDYTHYLLTVFLRIPFAFSSRASMGSEMYTSFASGPSLVEPLAALLLLMGLFAVVRLRIPWERLHRSGLTLIAAIAGPLLLASFVWVRAVDILWPFLILLLAGLVALAPDLPRRMLHAFAPRSPAGTGRILLLVLLLVCSARLYRLTELMTERNAHTALSRFAALSVLPEDATVLNIDWDLFPPFLSLRPDLTYATGIDVNLTAFTDRAAADALALPDAWEKDTTSLPDDLSPWLSGLRARLPGDYLVLATWRYPHLLPKLRDIPALEEVASERNGLTVFRINSESLP